MFGFYLANLMLGGENSNRGSCDDLMKTLESLHHAGWEKAPYNSYMGYRCHVGTGHSRTQTMVDVSYVYKVLFSVMLMSF